MEQYPLEAIKDAINAIIFATHPCHLREIVRGSPSLVARREFAEHLVSKINTMRKEMLNTESQESLEELLWEIEDIQERKLGIKAKPLSNKKTKISSEAVKCHALTNDEF